MLCMIFIHFATVELLKGISFQNTVLLPYIAHSALLRLILKTAVYP